MNNDIEKVKERKERRCNQYDHNNYTNDNKPFNDAMDHLSRIEGYPIQKPARMRSLPLPIRIIGYALIGFMAFGLLTVIILKLL